MKYIVLMLACIMFSSTAIALEPPRCPSQGQCDRDPEHLAFFVKTFFTWYVVSVSENGAFWKKNAIPQQARNSLTPVFLSNTLRQLSSPELDADPILCAQDFRYEWFYPEVTMLNMRDASATLKVSFATKGWNPHELIVTLTPSENHWRIDGIAGKLCEPAH